LIGKNWARRQGAASSRGGRREKKIPNGYRASLLCTRERFQHQSAFTERRHAGKSRVKISKSPTQRKGGACTSQGSPRGLREKKSGGGSLSVRRELCRGVTKLGLLNRSKKPLTLANEIGESVVRKQWKGDIANLLKSLPRHPRESARRKVLVGEWAGRREDGFPGQRENLMEKALRGPWKKPT